MKAGSGSGEPRLAVLYPGERVFPNTPEGVRAGDAEWRRLRAEAEFERAIQPAREAVDEGEEL